MLRWSNAAAILFAVLAQTAGTNAFVVPSPAILPRINTPITESSSTKLNAEYGEESRKFRRTVYTHEEWVKHRAPDRFIRNLGSITKSGVYKSVGKEVLATTAMATFVVLWNGLVGGFEGLDGVQGAPIIPPNDFLIAIGLPLTPFTLVSPALGLLLVFRTNSSYGRWDEARKYWGLNINHTRDLVRMATAWYGHGVTEPIDPKKREEDLEHLSKCTWAFVRSMKRHLSPVAEDEEDFKKELKERLGDEQADKIINAVHRPNRALYDLSMAIDNLPMNFLRKNQINTALTLFEDTLGGSERLLSSPIPLFYTRHTARFLLIWLLLLPFALYEPFKGSWNHIAMIPATSVISLCLFAIEELATELEEPFTILPMQGFCDKIGNWCNEIVSWAHLVPKSEYDDLEFGLAAEPLGAPVRDMGAPVRDMGAPEPLFSEVQPYFVETQPVVAPEQPVLAKPEPVVAKPEPVVAEPEPVVSKMQSVVAKVQSVFAKPEPVVAEPEPVVAEPEPVVAKPEPVVAEPEPVVAKPEPVVAKPEPVVAKPEPVVSKPEPVVAEPEPLVAEPEPVFAKVQPVVAEPEPVVAEPEPVVSKMQSVVTKVQSVVSKMQSVVAEPEPVVAKPEPVVAEPEPVVAKMQPVVAEPEPVVAEPEPVVAKVQPVVAEPEPVVAKVQQVVAEPEPVVAEPEPLFAEEQPVVSKETPYETYIPKPVKVEEAQSPFAEQQPVFPEEDPYEEYNPKPVKCPE